MNFSKTTGLGIVSIVTGVGTAVTEWSQGGPGHVNWNVLGVTLATGLGLIFAQDGGTPPTPPPNSVLKS